MQLVDLVKEGPSGTVASTAAVAAAAHAPLVTAAPEVVPPGLLATTFADKSHARKSPATVMQVVTVLLHACGCVHGATDKSAPGDQVIKQIYRREIHKSNGVMTSFG